MAKNSSGSVMGRPPAWSMSTQMATVRASSSFPPDDQTSVRRSAHAGPTPLQNVANSMSSLKCGAVKISTARRRSTHVPPSVARRSVSSASSVATSCRKRDSASRRSSPWLPTSPRWMWRDAR
jgi:hypothetical protein